MTLFRSFLVLFMLALGAYTLWVVMAHGANLFAVFFGDIFAITWAGQFNFDFSGFLLLSAFWTLWRNDFTGLGILLGILALFLGMMFLTTYLLYLSFHTSGNIPVMLLGQTRASRFAS